ncbi:MAG: hypothetical protein KDA89_19115 [Planctomycetaceae bacterium]|nr:hypothetical protein [Planctomycetaceae bacterium]
MKLVRVGRKNPLSTETDEEPEMGSDDSAVITGVSAGDFPHGGVESDDDRSTDISQYSNPGVNMSEDNSKPQNEVTTTDRRSTKFANSLTEANQPRMDSPQVDEVVLAPETEVLLIAVHPPERNTFRTYLRRHDIPCRAATSPETALSIVRQMKPAAILVSCSCLTPDEIVTLLNDLNDMVEAPVLALLTLPQIKQVSNEQITAHVLQYPASLRQVRAELTAILLEEANAIPRCAVRPPAGADN